MRFHPRGKPVRPRLVYRFSDHKAVLPLAYAVPLQRSADENTAAEALLLLALKPHRRTAARTLAASRLYVRGRAQPRPPRDGVVRGFQLSTHKN